MCLIFWLHLLALHLSDGCELSLVPLCFFCQPFGDANILWDPCKKDRPIFFVSAEIIFPGR